MDLEQDMHVGQDAAFDPEAAFYSADPVIDVDVEEIPVEPAGAAGPRALPRLADRLNVETPIRGLSLAQLAVHSLWIVDYLRQLGETEMADGDLESIGICADDLEGAIMMMFQLAGGTRQELRQRYQDLKRMLAAGMPKPTETLHI